MMKRLFSLFIVAVYAASVTCKPQSGKCICDQQGTATEEPLIDIRSSGGGQKVVGNCPCPTQADGGTLYLSEELQPLPLSTNTSKTNVKQPSTLPLPMEKPVNDLNDIIQQVFPTKPTLPVTPPTTEEQPPKAEGDDCSHEHKGTSFGHHGHGSHEHHHGYHHHQHLPNGYGHHGHHGHHRHQVPGPYPYQHHQHGPYHHGHGQNFHGNGQFHQHGSVPAGIPPARSTAPCPPQGCKFVPYGYAQFGY